MKKNSKIYIAGHRGMVGSALVRGLQKAGFTNIITKTHDELDLTDSKKVNSFFSKNKPQFVFLAAAKVGGIHANNIYRADFIYQNLMIQTNIIHAAHEYKVEKLMFLGSSCIYPKLAPQPLKEEYLLSSKLEPTNQPYAIAKIAGLEMCDAYNRQYKTDFMSVMPTNLYGTNDNFDLDNSHVLPALLRKIYLGKCLENDDFSSIRKHLRNFPSKGITAESSYEEIKSFLEKNGIIKEASYVSIILWGTGTSMREFLHCDDLADACIFLMKNFKNKQLDGFVNIGVGRDITIKALAELIKKIVDFKGELAFDPEKPDGTPKKLLDVEKLKKLGWTAKISLKEGLERTLEELLK